MYVPYFDTLTDKELNKTFTYQIAAQNIKELVTEHKQSKPNIKVLIFVD